MNKTITKGLASIAAAGSLLLVDQAAAAIQTFETTTPVPSTKTDWAGDLLFAQFDASLGTLNSVTLRLETGLDTILTVENSSVDASQGTVKTEMILNLTDSRFSGSTLDVITSPQSYVLDGGQTLTLPLVNRTGSGQNTYSSPSVLNDFTGTGNYTLGIYSFTQTLLANTGGNTAASQMTTANATGWVTYEYTPVPEPGIFGSLAGVGLGALGLFGLSRRANRR